MDSTTQRLMTSAGGPVDPFFENVTMLLHGDGTNGAQNNTFIDSSTNNFTITRNGNTTQGSLNPFGDRWSNYFDGTGDYLSLTNASALQLTNSGAFTIEFWVNPDSIGTNRYIFTNYNQSSPYQGYGFGIGCNLLNSEFQFWDGGSWRSFGLLTASAWTHVAISYEGSGTTGRVFLNGTQAGSSFTINSGINYTAGTAVIGTQTASTGFFTGYISNFRIVKGTAVYTAAFTPPASPLTAITNTSLLTCQSNRFIDNSSNNFSITRNGDVSVRPFSPFAPSAAYSTSVNGGSGYFDGTGDYLSAADNTSLNLTSGDFTIEAWVYWNGANSYGTVLDKDGQYASTYPQYGISLDNNGYMRLYVGSGTATASVQTITSSVLMPKNSWVHVAGVKSGTTLTLYQNGVSVASATQTITMGTSNKALLIGYQNAQPSSFYWDGYISNLRIVKGTAVYTAAFTPPTAPLTAITNTSLLLNFTNAGIFDSAADNVLETVGNAQISTSVKKYGTGSLAFDGTGDYIFASSSNLFSYGTGDFTWEMWVYPTSSSWTTVNDYFLDHGSNGGTLTYYNNVFRYYNATTGTGSALYTNGGTITANQWSHIAVSRQSGTTRLFVNGQLRTSGSDGHNYPAQTLTVANYGSGGFEFQGYIDDLRITKGVARYTADFTAPAGPLPDM